MARAQAPAASRQTGRATSGRDPKAPDRPAYPVISSGWDSEDEETRGKTSDLMTAIRALGVLSLFIVAIALLIR